MSEFLDTVLPKIVWTVTIILFLGTMILATGCAHAPPLCVAKGSIGMTQEGEPVIVFNAEEQRQLMKAMHELQEGKCRLP